jgi:NAD(P)-dependent dehydrogenase (short-subunit alcohol dehydrogenase family)
MRLRDKVAIVTGGARGIGHAIARRYLSEGAKVVIGDVLEVPPDTRTALGQNARYLRCDVGEEKDANALVASAVSHFGRLDICVNNAGILGPVPFLETTAAQFDEVIRTNLRGHFLVGLEAARQMVSQNDGGTIVNMSSINALTASHNQTAYATSKGGIHMLTVSMAVQLAEHGIRVNAIGPGTIATDMARPHIGPALLGRIPMARAGEEAEIAGVAVFLASDDASYITGQTIYADGGRLALNMPAAPRVRTA